MGGDAMQNIQQEIYKAIDILTEKKIQSLTYDKTVRGKVYAISHETCQVEINGEFYTCKYHIPIEIDDVVYVKFPSNNSRDKYVESVVGKISSGGAGGGFIGKTAAEWIDEDEIIPKNAIGIEEDTRKLKIGDGITLWSALPYMTQGDVGPGIEYDWDGTQLGIRIEGQPSYLYTDLKGAKGDKGDPFIYSDFTPSHLAALKGEQGNSIEYKWSGTQLGVRIEGQTAYSYVNLKGTTGDTGRAFVYADFTAPQLAALKGAKGDSIEFDWNGAQLGVRVEGQSTYQYANLKGVKGDTGSGLEYNWDGSQLGVRVAGTSSYSYTDLRGPKGETGSIESLTATHITNALGYTPLAKGLTWGDLVV